MNEETNTLIAKIHLNKTNIRDFSDWAVSCLEQDLDTKNIRIVAAMYDATSLSEIDTYFRRSLNELGWEFPQEKECLERYAKSVAQQIVDKTISPAGGCEVFYEIHCSLIYLNEEEQFNYFRDLYWCYKYLPVEEIDLKVIQEAERYLSGKKFIFPKNIEEKPLFAEIDKKESFLSKIWKKIS
ncbi:MAG: hypothetical protein AAB336_04870 [Acidobacteriota bacterium]